MGFYLRKSVRVGPLRFNLSNSGVGVSAGILGFRIGMGPRGNYIHAGRGGFYYRTTLPSFPSGKGEHAFRNAAVPEPLPVNRTIGREEEIESGCVSAMVDETSEGLLGELRLKRRIWRLTPLLGVVLVIVIAFLWSRLPPAGQIFAPIIGLLLLIVAQQYDVLRKTTVLMYDMDSEAQASFESLVAALQCLGCAQRLWHVSSRAEVLDRKYHAGAGASIRRHATTMKMGSAHWLKCNIDVPILKVGRQAMCFFPDRLLLLDSGSVGAINYASLAFDRQPTRFIEEEVVPGDGRIVDRTWRYVNKKGGPDRRFKDNRELPICEYEALHFRSASGLNELIHASCIGAGEALEIWLLNLRRERVKTLSTPQGKEAEFSGSSRGRNINVFPQDVLRLD